MLIVFNKERFVFDARDLLFEWKTEIINLPISIEIKFFDGVAPCGLALKIQLEDKNSILRVLKKHGIDIHSIFEVDKGDQEYKRVRSL